MMNSCLKKHIALQTRSDWILMVITHKSWFTDEIRLRKLLYRYYYSTRCTYYFTFNLLYSLFKKALHPYSISIILVVIIYLQLD